MLKPRSAEPRSADIDGMQDAEDEMLLPIKDWDDWKGKRSGPWWSKRISFRVLAVLLLLSLVVGFCGGSGVLRIFDALQAAKDAKGQVAFIEAQLRGGDITSTESLTTIQTHLGALHYDIVRLQADIPMESAMSNAPAAGGIVHVLYMAQDFVEAGQYAIDAALIIVPTFKEMLHSVGSSTATTASKSAPPPAITATQLQHVSDDVNHASALAQAGIVERSHVSDSSLQAIGLGSMISLLHKLDGYTPKLNMYLSDAHALVAALPTLLGLSTPTNLLLFDMDSDELRPTGGFLGNYALLTLAGGRLQNGVHLRDIRLLDCSPDGFASQCRANPLPSQYSWFPFSQQTFNVRDSNLDPNFPAAASLAIHLAHDLEGAPALSGVVAMTPAVIEGILKVTGPIKVASFGVTVTADNLQERIHYYHILAQYCLNHSQSYDPRCAQLSAATNGSTGTTQRKAFDSELGSALLHTVGALSSHQQGAVFKVILTALQTKDLQVYFTDPKLEAVLASLNVDGALRAPVGDSLDVVDTNIGATYVNGDIQERVTDNIVLDAHGTATHTMTITYTYPIVNHLWSSIYPGSGGYWGYYDVVRTIVPRGATLAAPSGCAPEDSPESNHGVMACAFTLTRADQSCGYIGCSLGYNYTRTATLHFHWSVPHAAVQSGSGMNYSLLFQKQAGTHITFAVTVTAPGQSAIQAQIPTQTPSTVSVKSTNRSVQFTGTLVRDTQLGLSY